MVFSSLLLMLLSVSLVDTTTYVTQYNGYSDDIDDLEKMPVTPSIYVDFSLSTPSAGVPKKLVEKAIAPLIDTIEADYIAHEESFLLNRNACYLDLRLSVDAKGVIAGVDVLWSEVESDVEKIARNVLEGSKLPDLPTQSFVVELSLLFTHENF